MLGDAGRGGAGDHDLRPVSDPIEPTARIRDIDVIRGAALFGVVWMNLSETTDAFMPAAVKASLPMARVDHVVAFGAEWLMAGKAQCLFGTLFGFGFALFTERLMRRRTDAGYVYGRRLAFLLMLGIVQMFLLWFGDILHDYAIVGFLLLLTPRFPNRALLAAAVFLLVFPGSVVADMLASVPTGPNQASHALHDAFWQALSRGNYADLVRLEWRRAVRLYEGLGVLAIWGPIAGQFLLGVFIYRQGWLQDPGRHLPVFRRAVRTLLPAGLAGSLLVLSVDPTRHAVLLRVGTQLATPVLAFGAAAALLLACRRYAESRPVHLFASLGRMALTNYVAESVFYFAVMDGFGFGLIRGAGATLDLLLAIAFVIVQAVVSEWWLHRYRFGPLEWLWRSATYGEWQRFRA